MGRNDSAKRFGSRVDVYLPEAAVPLLGLGAQAVAGETILADLRASLPAETRWLAADGREQQRSSRWQGWCRRVDLGI